MMFSSASKSLTAWELSLLFAAFLISSKLSIRITLRSVSIGNVSQLIKRSSILFFPDSPIVFNISCALKRSKLQSCSRPSSL